jgi:hypothetical protein
MILQSPKRQALKPQSLPLRDTQQARIQQLFWPIITLLIALLYGGLAIAGNFWDHGHWMPDQILQDDARQHVFWMQRWQNDTLFPQDWIADYFQSNAPAGYSALYHLATIGGISPLIFNKILPLPLGLITAWYTYRFTLAIMPLPLAGCLSALFLAQDLWAKDDLISGVARAFVYPIFIAFLNYLLRGQLVPCLITIVLEGLFYPQFTLVMGGLLFIRLVQQWRDPAQRRLPIAGLALTATILGYYALQSSAYGPDTPAALARTMPEFLKRGRTEFFLPDPGRFWFWEKRSGLLTAIQSHVQIAAIGLPWLCWRGKKYLPRIRQMQGASIFTELGIVALTLFGVAHALLFKLYLPGRYAQISLQLVVTIAGGITIALLLDQLKSQLFRSKRLAQFSLALIIVAFVYHPLRGQLPQGYSREISQIPQINQFIAQDPNPGIIATLSREANNLPSTTGHSIWVSREHALPYHQGYYQVIRERAIDLVKTAYSPDRAVVQAFTQKNQIRWWLIDRRLLQASPLDARYPDLQWLKQYSTTVEQVDRQLKTNQTPALVALSQTCNLKQENDFVLLDGACIASQANAN